MTVGVVLPLTLPQVPLTRSFQTAPQSNVVAFAPDVGPPKVRRRATARTQMLSRSFVYTTAQVGIFRAYFEDDLADGSLRMTWTDPLLGTADFLFSPETPYSLVPLTPSEWEVSWLLMMIP